MVSKGGAPRRLLRIFITLYRNYQEKEEELRRRGEDVTREGVTQVLWGPWVPRGYYVLKRMQRETKNEDIGRLADVLQEQWFQNLPEAGLAARWADLLTR